MAAEITDADLAHLRRCVELAEEAVAAGDFPFGSVLVAADGTVVAEDRNREQTEGDPTSHPELALARWAGLHMTPPERAEATELLAAVQTAMVGRLPYTTLRSAIYTHPAMAEGLTFLLRNTPVPI